MKEKLIQFSSEVGVELVALEDTVNALQECNTIESAALPDKATELFDRLIAMPCSKIFPALDLARLLILHPKVTSHAKRNFGAIEARCESVTINFAGYRARFQLYFITWCRVLLSWYQGKEIKLR